MLKILIADDDPDILDLVEYNLSKEGYNVMTAKDGKEAFDKASTFNPDMVILDIMMPEMDGVEVCGKLRSLSQFSKTLIVFLTARNEDFTQIACYDNGGDDYIVKPVKPKVLVSRINAIFRRVLVSVSKDSEKIKIGDLEIDLDQYVVLRKGEKISLAKKEFELLVLLGSKVGKLFSREEIFNKVWGFDQVISDRTIDVHIRKLREKIGDSYIRTVKGVGYKLESVD